MAEANGVTARLKALIVDSPIASVISNPRLKDNPIIACNASFIELTGYGEDEIAGRNCRFLAGPATEPWLTETIRSGSTSRSVTSSRVGTQYCRCSRRCADRPSRTVAVSAAAT